MKIVKMTIALALTIGLVSCGGETKETTNEVVKTETKETSYSIAPEGSMVQWEGTMIGVYSHSGDIKLKSGSLTVKDGMASAGEFVIDMKTINPTDENYSEEHPREMLIGHLGANDFFSVDSIPTTSFKITGSEGNKVMGDLTIKGVTKPGTISDVKIEEMNGEVKATGTLVFDRQEFGAAYKAAGDMVLSDDITLNITISGK